MPQILGKHAIYYYAVYLVASALIRDSIIKRAVEVEVREVRLLILEEEAAFWFGGSLFVCGLLLNLWTLERLGIKGMYNGDSFGHLMNAPVTDGPFRYLSDPQYVGTTMAMLGYAIQMQSWNGLVLTFVMGLTFYVSSKFIETPHMQKIYASNTKADKGQ